MVTTRGPNMPSTPPRAAGVTPTNGSEERRSSPRLAEKARADAASFEKTRKIQSTLNQYFPAAPTAKTVAKLEPGLRRFAQVRGWASAGKEVFPAFFL
jgi:hypothetical protein